MHRKILFTLATATVLLLFIAFATTIIRSGNSDASLLRNEKPGPEWSQPKPQVISLRITRNGFEPASLTVPAGEYTLAVHNRTEMRSLQLSLDREAGPRLKEVRMDLEKLNWRGKTVFTPGRYTLSATEDPRWTCQITVTTP